MDLENPLSATLSKAKRFLYTQWPLLNKCLGYQTALQKAFVLIPQGISKVPVRSYRWIITFNTDLLLLEPMLISRPLRNCLDCLQQVISTSLSLSKLLKWINSFDELSWTSSTALYVVIEFTSHSALKLLKNQCNNLAYYTILLTGSPISK